MSPLVRADCKIVQTSLHAREGDPTYTARAVFEVLEVIPEEPPHILIAGAYDSPAPGAIWRKAVGETWEKVADTVGYRGPFSGLLTSAGNLLIGTYFEASIWISQDWGLSWSEGQAIGDSRVVNCITELDTETLLLGTGDDGEVWRSTDGGFTWTFIRRIGSVIAGTDSVRNILQAANGDIIALFCTGDIPNPVEVWRSQDDGLTWSQITTIANTIYMYDPVILENGYIVCGSDDTALGDGRFYRSVDNGATWNSVQACVGSEQPQSFVVLENGDILAGTRDAGVQAEIWRSQDNGASWTYLSDVSTRKICDDLILDYDGSVVALCANSTGPLEVWRSQDSGASWEYEADFPGYRRGFYTLVRIG